MQSTLGFRSALTPMNLFKKAEGTKLEREGLLHSKIIDKTSIRN